MSTEIPSVDGGKTQTFLKDTSKLDELKQKLTPMQYKVAVERGTEPPKQGVYDKFFKDGKYYCIVCGEELFKSDDKFDAFCGWPAFAKGSANIEEKVDNSYGMTRTEVICKACGAHLGHLFPDGPPQMGGMRYCINSASINFKPK